MTLPAGVTLLSFKTSPKVATQPAYDNATNTVMWQLGHLKSGGRMKVSLKLVPAACSTPAPLALNGKFSYFTMAGLQIVDACLKKDVRALTQVLEMTVGERAARKAIDIDIDLAPPYCPTHTHPTALCLVQDVCAHPQD